LFEGCFNDFKTLGRLGKYISDPNCLALRIDGRSSTYRNVGADANRATEPNDFFHGISIGN
jgi:hypothetical protein